jgi:acyl dehydratase
MATRVSDRPASDLLQLDCRFTAPVIPGERIDFHFWQQDNQTLLFRALVGDRIVLNNGLATLK